EHAQQQSVRHEAPLEFRTSIEQLLYEAVGTRARRASDSGRARVEIDATAHEMNHDVQPEVRDGERLPIDADRSRRRQAAVPELLEDDEQPAFARHARRGIALRQLCARITEGRPRSQESVPRTVDRLGKGLSAQVIRVRPDTWYGSVTLDDSP